MPYPTEWTIDTAAVEHRTLRFAGPSDLLAEADRIAAAERAGTLRRTGNWTAGQTFNHLATWMNFAYDGYPHAPPWFIKVVLRMMKGRFMKGPLPRGKRIPGLERGTLATEALPLDEGLAKLHAAWAKLGKQTPTLDHPVFGPMPHQEWINMHLRHSELHMGYLHPPSR